MNDLLELAERCEKVTGPDRDLDALIAVAAGGADSVIGEWSYRYGRARELPWYTSSLDTAMRLVPDHDIDFQRRRSKAYVAVSFTPANSLEQRGEGWGATPALALCAAALRARAGQPA